MASKSDLFSVFSEACCEEYKLVRDAKTARLANIKGHCEKLWEDFYEHADHHFVGEFCRHFHQRWFEMYLSVALLHREYELQSRNEGPDILLELDDHRIWIEAVCATAGETGLPDSVPQVPSGKVARVPVDQYVLRISNALREKARRFRQYIDTGIVRECDTLAIAINVYGIDGVMVDIDRVMMRALYGHGDMLLRIDKLTKEPKTIDHEIVTKLVKRSGSEVGITPFVDHSFPHISSAMVFWGNAGFWGNAPNPPLRLGDDCNLYPNLSCVNVWRPEAIPMGREWVFVECEDGWKGSPIDHFSDYKQ